MGKALLAAICGAVLGAGILIGLGMSGYDHLWPALVVGLLCGIVMRVMAKHEGGSYANGALAAVALLAAVVGGKFALVGALSDPSSMREVDQQPAVAQNDAGDSAGEDVEQPAEEEPAPENVAAADTSSVLVTAPQGMEYSVADGLYMVIGALIAYQVGKGEGGRRGEEEPESEGPAPEGAPPADGQGDGDQQP